MAERAVDREKEKAEDERLATILRETEADGMAVSGLQWKLYKTLYALGCRIDRADFEIRRLAPRVQG